jgi:hypothetical protein
MAEHADLIRLPTPQDPAVIAVPIKLLLATSPAGIMPFSPAPMPEPDAPPSGPAQQNTAHKEDAL